MFRFIYPLIWSHLTPHGIKIKWGACIVSSFFPPSSILFHTLPCDGIIVRLLYDAASDQHYHRWHLCAGHKCCSRWAQLEHHIHDRKSRWVIWTTSYWSEWTMAVSFDDDSSDIVVPITNVLKDHLLSMLRSTTLSRSMYTMHWTSLQLCMHMGCSKMGQRTWMVQLWLLSGKISYLWSLQGCWLAFFFSPIPPGYDFTYEFNITQYGTFWIHSHFMVC